MFENHAIKLINRQLSWLTGSLTCLRAFISVKQLSSLTCLRAFTSVKQFSSLLRLQFTPLTVNARHYMFENQAIKLINRQLSFLINR